MTSKKTAPQDEVRIILHVSGKVIDLTKEFPKLGEVVSRVVNDKLLNEYLRVTYHSHKVTKKPRATGQGVYSESTHSGVLEMPVVKTIEFHSDYVTYDPKHTDEMYKSKDFKG